MDEPVMQPLSPADETIVTRHRDIIGPCRIRLAYTDDPAGQKMTAFCERISELLADVSVVRKPAEDEPPAIHISDNMHFQVVPSGKLLEGFLMALAGHDFLNSTDFGVNAGEIQQRIGLPATFKMYVSVNCPYCPQALQRALFLAGALSARVDIRIIDAQLFSKAARADQVRSVPTTILDDRFRWTGVFDLSEVVNIMADRDPAQLGTDTLKKMIADGNAGGVADLMGDAGIIIPGFFDLLTDPKWSVRLGAMVAFEYLAERDPGLSRKILETLWERFDAFDDPVKGDILHLFGVLDDPELTGRLQRVSESSESNAIKQVASEIVNAARK